MLFYKPCRGDRFRMKSARSRSFPRPGIALLIASLLTCALPYGRATAAITLAQQPLQRPTNRGESAGARPRLVLLIVVDQFRYDSLTRFADLLFWSGLHLCL